MRKLPKCWRADRYSGRQNAGRRTREKLVLRMEQELHSRAIGQNEAVEAVFNATRRSRVGPSDPPNRPRLVPSVPWADRGR